MAVGPQPTKPVRRPPWWLFPPCLFTYAVLSIFTIEWCWPHPSGILHTRLGWSLVLGGVSLVGWAAALFGRARTPIMPCRQATTLLTGGPFRFSRNPLYLAEIMMLSGLILLVGGVLAWVVIPLFALAIDRLFIRGEEENLAAHFGPAYAEYARRVRRWL